jgi:hypothetical protein
MSCFFWLDYDRLGLQKGVKLGWVGWRLGLLGFFLKKFAYVPTNDMSRSYAFYFTAAGRMLKGQSREIYLG